jgi:hypothetical protein
MAGPGHDGTRQVEWFDLAGLLLGLGRMVACWTKGRRRKAGGGIHRLLETSVSGEAPFAWLTGVTSPRQVVGAEYLGAMVRPGEGVSPRSDRGRPVSWLTDPSRRVKARHPK